MLLLDARRIGIRFFQRWQSQEAGMAVMSEIEAGQHWVVEQSCIAVVLERADETSWLVNRLEPLGGTTANVAVEISHFHTRLQPHQARRKAMEIVQTAALRFLKFA